MAKKQFKAESKRLLDLMINSIYTNREIFLRELISNASDALDKRYYLSLTDDNKRFDKKKLKIEISLDKLNRTITISDTGIGMTEKELESNLGTIAKSGSLEFKKELDEATKNIDIIGQFGVGFYSAFMIANKIIVDTKSIESDTGYTWTSEGEDGYTITPSDREQIGTTITLFVKEDTSEDNFSEYLESYHIQQLVTKYSDYVRYPIEMMVETIKPKAEDESETETILETRILNSMIPLWKKNKKKISEEEYNEFYKSKFMDWENPQKVIHYTVEGTTSYNALLFIPSKAPYNFYNADYEPGLQLYCKGVFIMDKAKDLLPDYFRFVKGLIDSDDLNLNISREILQQDRQMKVLGQSIEKKIKNNLEDLLKNDRAAYETFFTNFGLTLKYGIYQDYGIHAENLKDLILFKSSKDDTYVTLQEYVERMKDDQEYIYYACGENMSAIKNLPQMEKLQEKEIEVLYFVDDVDEFAINVLRTYNDKKFKSVNQGDLGLDSDEEKKEKEEKAKENHSLLESMKEALKENVKEVRISSRLKSHPVCLVSEDGISLEMEKILANAPNSQDVKANKILEINPDHAIFKTLQSAYTSNSEVVKEYAEVLYNQALLIEGLPIEDPIAYANKICNIMINANK